MMIKKGIPYPLKHFLPLRMGLRGWCIRKRFSEHEAYMEKVLVHLVLYTVRLFLHPEISYTGTDALLLSAGGGLSLPSRWLSAGLASLTGRDRGVLCGGSSTFCDSVPWSTSFLRKVGDGSRTSSLLAPVLQFPPFGRTEFDFSRDYYGLRRAAPKLALRRWKGRESSLWGAWFDASDKSYLTRLVNRVACRVLSSVCVCCFN